MGFTSDPKDPRIGRGIDDKPRPQNETYLVLSDAERAKGFVRPVRTTYRHVGRAMCLKSVDWGPEHGKLYCTMDPAHTGSCEVAAPMPAIDRQRGCGCETTMGMPLAETYARDPNFYGATYCVNCQMHRPVNEFVWIPGGSRVGS